MNHPLFTNFLIRHLGCGQVFHYYKHYRNGDFFIAKSTCHHAYVSDYFSLMYSKNLNYYPKGIKCLKLLPNCCQKGSSFLVLSAENA